MNKEDIFRVLLKRARPEILKEFNPDSCIVSTAVCVDVFRHFGFKAEPLPVRVMVFNKAAMKCIEKFGWPKHDTTIYQWGKKYGAWSVGVGFPKGRTAFGQEGYVGHLVAIIDDEELIDLSLDQASRPGRHIALSPLRLRLTDAFKERKQRLATVVNGCGISYEQIANNTYTFSPDWLKKGRRQRIINVLIQEIEENANT